MLLNPNQQIQKSLHNLDGNHDFEIIKKWLADSLLDIEKTFPLTKDEAQARWYQGACQVLRAFADNARRKSI